MKKLALLGMAVMAAATVANANPGSPQVSVGISFGVFYSSLSSQGEWIAVDDGLYAWRPQRVMQGWRPYVSGRWVWSEYGWYWVSDEPWAWAVYHYGRWYYDDYYGWLWIPGYDWAPAWVEWRYGGDYVGWAPLGPYAVFGFSTGIHYRRPWTTPYHYWTFVDCRYIDHPDLHRYVYRRNDNRRLIGMTRSGGDVRYEGGRIVTRGPGRDFVERRGGRRLEQAEIVDVRSRDEQRVTRTGDRERIEVFRPKPDEGRPDARMDRPESVRKADRPLSIDTRSVDSRVRDREREEGRDVRRDEPLSVPQGGQVNRGREVERDGREMEMRRDAERRPDPRIERRTQEKEVSPRYNPERRIERERGARTERSAPQSKPHSRVSKPERSGPPKSESARGSEKPSRGSEQRRER